MIYQSVTTWQADDFEVEVRYGFFSTAWEAAQMARDDIQGVLIDCIGMWADLRDGTRAPIRKGSCIVRRLREASRAAVGNRALNIDDFEIVEMSTEAMRIEPSMRSFCLKSYGVIDAHGEPVALPI